MEIQQLRGFQAVARYKNFTVAARKTLRTQPTISLQVKSLEDELGVRLFERLGPKKVSLTSEGQMLYDLTTSLVEDFDQVQTRFQEARGKFDQSVVRVVTHRSVMVHLLPNIIKKFKTQYPSCRLSILNRTREEIISMIEEGEADIGISSLAHCPPQLEYHVISRFNRILIATKDHPISEKKNISIEDIAEFPLILPTKESHTRKIIDSLFEKKGLQYNLTMEVVGRDAIKTYVGMNLGISIINEYYLLPEDRRRLFVKDLSRLFGYAESGVITRKGRALPATAREFISLLE